MKKYLSLTLILFSITTFSQKKFEGKATYMSKRTLDMSRFGQMSEQQKKQMKARFKNFLEKTLDEAANINSSLLSDGCLKLNFTLVGDNSSTFSISAKSCLREGIPFSNKI